MQNNQDGELVVDTTDQSAYPSCATSSENSGGGVKIASEESEEHAHLSDVAGEGDAGEFVGVSADAVEITVLVAYSSSARSAQGGTAAIQAVAQNAIDAANNAYVNSDIGIQLRLVGTVEYNYNNADFGTSLSHLRGTSDGNMDGIHGAAQSVQRGYGLADQQQQPVLRDGVHTAFDQLIL